MVQREKISAVDTAWLRMDRPGNPMMICAVLVLRQRLPRRRLRAVLEERFLCFGRFRQRAVQEGGVAMWELADDFDLDQHLLQIVLPEPAGEHELQALASRLAGAPLDPNQPLWQFHLVTNYGEGSALVARIHHAYADGIALVQVMLSLTDAAPRGPAALPMPPPRRRRSEGDAGSSWLSAPLDGALRIASGVGTTIVQKGVELWMNPLKAFELAREGGAITRDIAELALMKEDSPTRFKGVPGGHKRVAWAKPLVLDEVKTIGRALSASVNDVLLACVAGALGGYLRAQDDALDGVMMRALVPVNLRPANQAHRLGNEFGLVFLELPLGIENPVERVYALRANMQALKGSYQPVLALGLLAAMGAGPKLLQDQLLEMLAKNATAVMTNVPGPQQPLYLAGAMIESLMFWVPQSGNIGMGASIISYDGKVQFGLITDREICPEPERIVAGFSEAFETLVLATVLSPWPWTAELDPQTAARAAGIA